MKLPRFEPTSLSPSNTQDIEPDDDDDDDDDDNDGRILLMEKQICFFLNSECHIYISNLSPLLW